MPLGKKQKRDSKERRDRFVKEYLKNGFNAKRAYMAAGFKAKGNSAEVSAMQLLKEPRIKAAVDRAGKTAAKRADVKIDQVVQRLKSIAFDGNLGTFLTWGKDGMKIRESKNLSKDDKALLREFSLTPRGLRIKLHEPTKALELLGRYLGMFKDSVDVNLKGADVDKAQVEKIVEDKLQAKAREVFA